MNKHDYENCLEESADDEVEVEPTVISMQRVAASLDRIHTQMVNMRMVLEEQLPRLVAAVLTTAEGKPIEVRRKFKNLMSEENE